MIRCGDCHSSLRTFLAHYNTRWANKAGARWRASAGDEGLGEGAAGNVARANHDGNFVAAGRANCELDFGLVRVVWVG